MGLDLPKILSANPSIALDSTIFIYALNEQDDFPDAAKLLTYLRESTNVVATSVMTLLEVAVHPYQTGDEQLVEEHRHFVDGNGRIRILPVSQAIALKAAQLRAQYRLKTPDAIHLASALEYKCQLFFTADRDFQKILVENLEIVTLTPTSRS